jgi:hypothetical protein
MPELYVPEQASDLERASHWHRVRLARQIRILRSGDALSSAQSCVYAGYVEVVIPHSAPVAASTVGSVVTVSDHDNVWTLHRRADGEVLAELVVTGGDLPWLNARVDPRAGLKDVLPLFADELQLLDEIDENPERWERAYDAIQSSVTLRDPDGLEVPEFLLHLTSDHAWWRWSDEPFNEDNDS